METENRYTETDLGNVSQNPRGEYDATASYEYLDMVSYQGGSYVCRAELGTTISGTAPEPGHNTDSWQMIALPGDLTSEYTAMHDEVINKTAQAEASRAAAELAQQTVEDAQADVQQLHADTRQAATEASQSRDSAAGYARSAEQSRNATAEAEQNINAHVTGFDNKVSESVTQAQKDIAVARQQAVGTITNQQNTSVNAVKTEGEKIITRVGNDAKTVADDRATVEEAAQTVLNNAQKVAQNTQTVASNTENAAASAESAKTSADNAAQSAKSVEDTSKQIEQNKKDVASLREDISNKITKFYASNQGNTNLQDSDDGKVMDMMIYGKSEQFATTGKNLLKIKDGTQTTRGVTVTVKDGVFVLKGTATETGWAIFDVDSFVLDGTCVLSSNIPTDVRIAVANKSFVSVLEQNKSDTLENAEVSKVCFTITEGKTYGISNILVQIEKGSKATSYEPYTGGQPSPSPDYPQEIKSVMNPTVKITNEDGTQFKTVTLPYTLNAAPASSDGNVTIDGRQYIANYIDLERGKLVKYLYAGKLGDLQYTVNPAKDPKWYDASISNSFELTNLKYKGVTFKNGALTAGFCNKAKTYGFAEFYEKNIECGVMNKDAYIIVNLPISLGINTAELFREWSKECYIIKMLSTPIESDLTAEEIEAFKELPAYYPVTNISVASDQLDGYVVFNYPISLANGWNYVKQQLNDNRDYIYDMDTQSAEAYVNSEYAVVLTELEV